MAGNTCNFVLSKGEEPVPHLRCNEINPPAELDKWEFVLEIKSNDNIRKVSIDIRASLVDNTPGPVS